MGRRAAAEAAEGSSRSFALVAPGVDLTQSRRGRREPCRGAWIFTCEVFFVPQIAASYRGSCFSMVWLRIGVSFCGCCCRAGAGAGAGGAGSEFGFAGAGAEPGRFVLPGMTSCHATNDIKDTTTKTQLQKYSYLCVGVCVAGGHTVALLDANWRRWRHPDANSPNTKIAIPSPRTHKQN